MHVALPSDVVQLISGVQLVSYHVPEQPILNNSTLLIVFFLILSFAQARSYIQSLAFKPRVPWQRYFPVADNKGTN